MEQSETVEKLKEYLETQDAVVMAFLFGSRAEKRERRLSDWDIGVYLKKEDRETEATLWRNLEKLLGISVDLVVLNRAPARIAWRVVGQGEPLTIKDRGLYLDFIIRVSEEADAFYRTSQEYYQIFQRSASLSASDRDRIRRILVFLEEEVNDYGRFRALTFEEYSRERPKKRDVEHWIEQLVNAVVDVAKIILASERRPIPETYAEMIVTLGSVEPFGEGGLCEKLASWVQLRNILAHEYLDLRWKNISEFVAATEPLWQEFIRRTKKFLEKNGSS